MRCVASLLQSSVYLMLMNAIAPHYALRHEVKDLMAMIKELKNKGSLPRMTRTGYAQRAITKHRFNGTPLHIA